jgi:Holliday junction resolvase RusA-like endonuclease
MSDELYLFAHGTAIAQGSKRHVGGGRMVESAKGLKDWRNLITQLAAQERAALDGLRFHHDVHVVLAFYVARPKAHHVAGDPSRPLKASAPGRPITKPDLDKTSRAVLDALTAANVWDDDAQVVDLRASKHYAYPGQDPGVRISVREVTL